MIDFLLSPFGFPILITWVGVFGLWLIAVYTDI